MSQKFVQIVRTLDSGFFSSNTPKDRALKAEQNHIFQSLLTCELSELSNQNTEKSVKYPMLTIAIFDSLLAFIFQYGKRSFWILDML